MDVIEKMTNSLMRVNKSWNIPLSSLSNHLNGKKIQEDGVCLQNDCIDFSYARMWIFHRPTIAKDEGCITHTNIHKYIQPNLVIFKIQKIEKIDHPFIILQAIFAKFQIKFNFWGIFF